MHILTEATNIGHDFRADDVDGDDPYRLLAHFKRGEFAKLLAAAWRCRHLLPHELELLESLERVHFKRGDSGMAIHAVDAQYLRRLSERGGYRARKTSLK